MEDVAHRLKRDENGDPVTFKSLELRDSEVKIGEVEEVFRESFAKTATHVNTKRIQAADF